MMVISTISWLISLTRNMKYIVGRCANLARKPFVSPRSERALKLFVERGQTDLRRSISTVVEGDGPGLAADLAILNVLLRWPAAGIDRDLHGLVAIGTVNAGRCFSRAVAERKLGIQVLV